MTDTIVAGHHQPLRVWILCLYVMGLNLSNHHRAQELALSPESLHQVTILFSDRGLPRGYRHLHGFGSHTFSFINAANERFWVKFHFKTMQGIENLTNEAAAKLIGADRESA